VAFLLHRRGRHSVPHADGLAALGTAGAAFTAAGWTCTGVGSVCLRPSETTPVVSAELSTDEFGHHWLTRRAAKGDVAMMATELHGICTSVAEAGLGQSFLCALVGFQDSGGDPTAMIYRFKRGAWYPFVPSGDHARDNVKEISLQAAVGDALPIETDLTKWSPLWGAPGMPRAAPAPTPAPTPTPTPAPASAPTPASAPNAAPPAVPMGDAETRTPDQA
jgi:hypothetical protein